MNSRPRSERMAGVRREQNSGKSVTINNLPPASIKRWTFLRKSQVVLAVRHGLIARDHACERYCISLEEFLSWDRAINKHGLRGLQTTRTQEFRESPPRANEEAWKAEDA